MEICSEDRLKLHHDAFSHWPFIQRIDWSCFYCIEYITNSIKSKLRLDVEKPISAKYGSWYIIGLHIRKRWIITLTFNQVHLELLHNLYQWREKIHFRQFISLWKYALDIYPSTLWRDLLWPSLTFDQYHCTFLYTSNFQWMKYKPDETMGRGNMLWTGIYREMWFDLLFFYLNKGYCTSIIHSNYMKET